MPLSRLKSLLDDNKIPYTIITHPTAFTSAAVGALTHTPGREIAKTVIVDIDGVLAMCVVPASAHVDLRALRAKTGSNEVSVAPEHAFAHVFPDCEVGAMPPFGNLYGLTVYVDEIIAEDKEISFNCGNHRETMRLAYVDFEKVVKPEVMRISTAKAAEHHAMAWNE